MASKEDDLGDDFEAFLNEKSPSRHNVETEERAPSHLGSSERKQASFWLKSKSPSKNLPSNDSINTAEKRSYLLQDQDDDQTDSTIKVPADIANLAISDDSENEKEKFFLEIGEKQQYSKLNEELAEDSVDYGMIPEYTDDFEESLGESETRKVEPTIEMKNDNPEENVITQDNNDDLESIKSSIQDIESSLDMTDTEVIDQLDSIDKQVKANKSKKKARPHVGTVFNPLKSLSVSSSISSKKSSRAGTPATGSKTAVSDTLELRATITRLQKELEFSQKLFDDEQAAHRKLKKEVDSISEKYELMAKENHFLKVENDDLKKLSPAMLPQVDRKKHSDESSNKPDENANLLKEQERLIKGFQIENERIAEQLKSAQKELKGEKTKAEQEKLELLNEISLLKTRMTENQSPRERRREENYQEQLEALKREQTDSSALFHSQIDSLKLTLSEQRQTMERTIEAKEKQIAKIRQELRERDDELKLLRRKSEPARPAPNDVPSTKSQTLVKSTPADTKKLKSLERDIVEYKNKLSDSDKRIASLIAAMSDAEQRFAEEKLSVQEEFAKKVADMRIENLRLVNTLQAKVAEIERLKDDMEKLKQVIETDPVGTGKLLVTEQELAHVRMELEKTNEALSHARKAEDALDSVKNALDTLKADLKTKTESAELLSEENKRLSQKLMEYQQQCIKHEAIAQQFSKQLAELSTRQTGAESSELYWKSELETMTRRCSSLETECASLKQKLEISEALKQNLSVQFNQLLQENQSVFKSSLSHQDQPRFKIARDQELEAKLDAKEKEVNELNSSLRQKSIELKLANEELEILREQRRSNTDDKRTQAKANEDTLLRLEKTVDKYQLENARLRLQIDAFKSSSQGLGLDSQSWNRLLEEMVKVETQVRARDEKVEKLITIDLKAELAQIEQKYQEQLQRKDQLIKRLRGSFSLSPVSDTIC